MDEFSLFEAFEREDYLPQQYIKKVISYICGQLISWLPNRSYYHITLDNIMLQLN